MLRTNTEYGLFASLIRLPPVAVGLALILSATAYVPPGADEALRLSQTLQVRPQACSSGKNSPNSTQPSTFEKILKSPLTRSVANQLTRSPMGALLGPTRRRR